MGTKDIKFALYNFLKKNPENVYSIEELSSKLRISRSMINDSMVFLVSTGAIKKEKEKDSERNIFKYSFNF